MKPYVWLILLLAGCSDDRAMRGAEVEREAKTRQINQHRQQVALQVYGGDARASCEAEIAKTKASARIIPGSTTVRWDPEYLTGERSRTKQQYPASEAFTVNLQVAGALAGKRAPAAIVCQVVCLDKGYCNTVGVN